MTTPLQDKYVEMSTILSNHPADDAILLQARLNAAYKQYNMGLITPEEFKTITEKIETQCNMLSK